MLQINATDCINRPVGLQNPDYIPDSAFTANYDHGTFSPHMARINSGGGTRNMWIAGAVNNWVQVDLGQMYTVFAIGLLLWCLLLNFNKLTLNESAIMIMSCSFSIYIAERSCFQRYLSFCTQNTVYKAPFTRTFFLQCYFVHRHLQH